MEFIFAPEARAVGVTGAYLVISGVRNRAGDDDFAAWQARALDEVLARWPDAAALAEEPVLAGFRALHEAVGAPNRKNLASPENLLRLLLKSGALPRVNLLVDIYNTVSVRTRLALGAHDVARITGNVTLRLTDGSEGFHPLGAPAPEPVKPGEYGYVDDANDVICRLEVRQVEKTKVTGDTTAPRGMMTSARPWTSWWTSPPAIAAGMRRFSTRRGWIDRLSFRRSRCAEAAYAPDSAGD